MSEREVRNGFRGFQKMNLCIFLELLFLMNEKYVKSSPRLLIRFLDYDTK